MNNIKISLLNSLSCRRWSSSLILVNIINHQPQNFLKMSLFLNTGVHVDQLNAEQMRKRGIFINVAPSMRDDNGRTKIQSEHQTPTFVRHRNNLNISPGEVGREAFTNGKTSWKKVRDKRKWRREKGTLPLHSNYANYK